MNRPTNEVLGRLAFLANTRGIIPDPIDATRITKSASQSGAGTNVFYTVPAGKVLFIDSAWLGGRETADADSYFSLASRDTGDAFYLAFLTLGFTKAGQHSLSNQYIPALEFPAGYDVYLESGHANIKADAGFSGWLESV